MNISTAASVTSKELAYLSDSLKNEDLLIKLCVQGAVQSQTQQLGQTLAQMAEDRLQHVNQLLSTLQQQGNAAYAQ